jgi:eukaryotic-like serine/threonine-protein kinase
VPADTFVDFDQSLNKAVNRLREVLEDSAEQHRLIETLPRRGYRFAAPVVMLQSTDSIITTETQPDQNARPAEPRRGRRAILLSTSAIVVATLLGLGLWLARRPNLSTGLTVQRLSFGRGTIRMARFGPDGHTIIYGAAWDGNPYELFLTQSGSAESRSLGIKADLLAVSRQGELAVLLNPAFGIIAARGTLALVPPSGNAPRPLMEHVQDADWSADGSKLAITHYLGRGCALEFPPGDVLYQTTGGAWLSHPRVSPQGTQIAFLEHPMDADNIGFVAVVDLTGKKTILTKEFGDIQGLAWDPSGNGIWFSASEPNSSVPKAIFKLTTSGEMHMMRRESASLTVLDVSRNGDVLFTRDVFHEDVSGRIYPDQQERKLGWLDNSEAEVLSPDGSVVLLSTEGEPTGQGYEIYLRRTDGSPAIRMGNGLPRALSPDGKWILATEGEGVSPPIVRLLPTGTGKAKTLASDGFRHHWGTFFPDGKSLLFEGNESGHATRNWVQDIGGGKPRPVTPEGTIGHRISPDARWLVAVDSADKYWLYRLAGGLPIPLPGVKAGEEVRGWSANGRAVFVANASGVPVRVYRLDIQTGRRQFLYELEPKDRAGLWSIHPTLLTPDGRSYVYSYYQILSDLYLATALH